MKTFTLQQAKTLLPLLDAEIKRLRPLYFEFLTRWEELVKLSGNSVSEEELRNLCLADEETSLLYRKVEESLCFFKELGVECKGIEEGLFDFPCLFEDRLVYLCWKEGEEDISHWHELEDGFARRKELLEAASLNREQAFIH